MLTRGSSRRCKKSGPVACNSLDDLPSNVVDKILMCLPLKDAARTSVLSSEWRYKWTNLPKIKFDDTFFIESRDNWDASKDKLFSHFYQILLVHRAPIWTFIMDCCFPYCDRRMNYIMQHLLSHAVEKFSFKPNTAHSEKLPNNIFSFTSLKHLKLRQSTLSTPPAAFGGFKNLVSLKLLFSYFDGNTLQRLISGCPQLQLLKIYHCGSYMSKICIEIDAPNLQFLELTFGLLTIGSFSFKHAPKLGYVLIWAPSADAWGPCNVIEFLNSLHSVKDLRMARFSLKWLDTGNKLGTPSASYQLKSFHLHELDFGTKSDIYAALCLIGNCKNLRTITILGHGAYYNALGQEPLDVQHSDFPVILNQLEEVRIEIIHGWRTELDFIKFLLAISPRWKKFYIVPEEATKELQLAKNLLELPRASPVAEMKLLDPQPSRGSYSSWI